MPIVTFTTDLNGPLPGTGRVRRHLRLKGRARRSPHKVTADLQTCDTRSAGAYFIRRHHGVSPWILTFRLIGPVCGISWMAARGRYSSCRGRNRTDLVPGL